LATSLAHGTANRHAAVDGNKPTAIVACEPFIEPNQGMLDASGPGIPPMIPGLAEGRIPESDFAVWQRDHLHRRPGTSSIQEAAAACASKRQPKGRSRATAMQRS
jgi:death-on-curing protein